MDEYVVDVSEEEIVELLAGLDPDVARTLVAQSHQRRFEAEHRARKLARLSAVVNDYLDEKADGMLSRSFTYWGGYDLLRPTQLAEAKKWLVGVVSDLMDRVDAAP